MHPLTCPDGQSHEFDTETLECSKCNTSYQQVLNAEKNLQELISKIKNLISFTNGGDSGILSKALYLAMCQTHRTLQQNFIRSLVGFIDQMKDMPTDLRNEASVKWCQEVSKIDNFLPMV